MKSKPTQQSAAIFSLPLELFLKIFSYLDHQDLKTLCTLCATMKLIAENNHFWFDTYKTNKAQTLFYDGKINYKNKIRLDHFIPIGKQLEDLVIANMRDEGGILTKRASFIFIFNKLLKDAMQNFSSYSRAGLLGALQFEKENILAENGNRRPIFKIQPSYGPYQIIKSMQPAEDNIIPCLQDFAALAKQLPEAVFSKTSWRNKANFLQAIDQQINVAYLKLMPSYNAYSP